MMKDSKILCCDLKGFLSYLVLSIINEKPRSGEDISIEIEKRKGDKPSPGTIYPVLKHLKEQGFIIDKKDGKSMINTLTPKGENALKEAKKRFKKMFKDF